MIRRPTRLERGVLAVTVLLAAVTVAWASVPPRPLRSVLTAVHAVSLSVATYWLVVVALLAVAGRIAGGERVTRRAVGRLAAVVFLGALAVEASPLARLAVDPAVSVGTLPLAERAIGAVRAALYPAGLFLGTGLAALVLREAHDSRGRNGDRDGDGRGGGNALPFAPRDRLRHGAVPAAVWRLGRVLAGVAVLYAALGVLAALAVTPDPDQYVVLALAEASVGALGALADHLVVGAALVALLASGVTARSLAVAAGGVLAATFLLGIAVALVGALLGVAVVGATVTPIPAVESADLVDWPDPLAWDTLVLVGTVVAAGVGLRTIQGSFARLRRGTGGATTGDSSDVR